MNLKGKEGEMLTRFLIRQPGANQRLRGAWACRSRVVREDDDLGTGAGIGGGGWEGALKVVGGVMAAGSALAGYGKKAVKGLPWPRTRVATRPERVRVGVRVHEEGDGPLT